MLYKVFLVEDEIVAREGIRDNVDWQVAGFGFCGEAPDGEVALPLIENTQPDVLITDIKMPFMDGLQLCKIIRERMPWVKIVILSGHDEFHYAQEAVKLGVTEYLLKPVSAQELNEVLKKIAAQLDNERQKEENVQKLRDQVEHNQAILRERFLLKLVMGAVSPSEAIEKSQMLELDIVAQFYQVMVIKIELCDGADEFDFYEFQEVERMVANLTENNPGVFLLKKDLEELILIMMGENAEVLEQEGYFLSELTKSEMASQTRCIPRIGMGSVQSRLGNIHKSFSDALKNIENQIKGNGLLPLSSGVDRTELLKLDQAAIEDYLKCGVKDKFDRFFDDYIRPLGEAALNSYIIRNYIFIDIVLATARFIKELGGDIDQAIPEINQVEMLLMNITTVEQIREQAKKILVDAVEFRDRQTQSQYTTMIHHAQEYIDHHYSNPDLSLNQVAAHVNLSPSHFSTVFSQETDSTFKEYLTEIRIKKAKELLRTTTLKSFEISHKIGYNDPHYFSSVFKKNTGLSPKNFRLQARIV